MKGSFKLEEEKLIRFLNNQSSQKERTEILKWLDRPESEREIEKMLSNRWEQNGIADPEDKFRYNILLERIHLATIDKDKNPRRWGINKKFVEMARVAATYLLLLFAAYILYQSWQPLIPEPLAEKNLVQLIERKTAIGEKLRITLPDKSKVIVNSMSTITFDSGFGKTNRLITLEGEAFFEVTTDKKRPFKVHTGDVITTALGTAFNAFSRDGQVEVSLTEGKVNVSHMINEVELNPGEQAALIENNGEGFRTNKFDPVHTTAWKEGKIRFTSKPLGEIITTLEEWYGVDMSIQGKIDLKRKVTGVFDNESLEEILKGLSFSIGLDYKIKGETVILKPNGI